MGATRRASASLGPRDQQHSFKRFSLSCCGNLGRCPTRRRKISLKCLIELRSVSVKAPADDLHHIYRHRTIQGTLMRRHPGPGHAH